jgi:hypothetical protein
MGIFLPMLISGIGAAIKANAERRNAQAIVDARNGVLRETMAMNRPLAENSRAQFDDRIANTATPAAEAAAVDNRQTAMSRAVEPPMPTAPLVGEGASTVVNSEIARAMSEAATAGANEASALGRVGAYGDMWFGQGQQNQNLATDLRTNANFAGGNLALLPHLQDLAEVGAPRRSGVIGDVLMGVGGAMGSRAGANVPAGQPMFPRVNGWFNRRAPLPEVGPGELY